MKLKEKRNQLIEQAQALVEAAVAEERAMTGEETEQYNRLLAEADALKATIDAEERATALRAELERPTRPALHTTPDNRGDERAQAERREAFIQYLAGKNPEKRAITQSTAGTVLLPTTLYDRIIDGLKMYGGIRAARVTFHRNLVGTVNIPVANDTNKGKRTSTGAATAVDPSALTSVALTPWEYTSNTIVIDRALLDGSPLEVEAMIASMLAERIARITNEENTTGTGSGMPLGVLTGAQLGVTGATTAGITWEELVDLEHSVPAQFRMNAQYMLNDKTLKVIKKLKDQEGRPLWQAGIAAGAPPTINGYTYVINDDMPDLGAGNKSILFGDFSRYHVGDGLNWGIRVLNELYAANNQVGFILFSQHGGTLADAAGAIKYFQNAAI